ncbi:hypothetical protein PPYR_06444 [Photinus pyralis]|uniref:Peptidase M20 dimerisation domain-containing protein n=2 Tax=Photinus pyralis TaxID=7054 RepID=A0A5N4ATJ8_PHOPY|nr:cytosolic non-specific dipeptidase-like isoform X1 [Photinus pyralis]XP_031338241.1 cytosolic non-specific dipeptidase-like isoform X1 [Photinus pyralis]KAB0800705.1 hypothetical protein PPYR_06444 [Photinus pyralis]
MEVPTALEELFKYIDKNTSRYIETLREAVAIRSVSSLEECREETCKMVNWTAGHLRKLGVEVCLKEIGTQVFPSGNEVKFPPVLLGTLGNDPKKKTICIYGHLDVQPALKDDGWNTEPFEMAECDGRLYGRGAADDKGPVLACIQAIEAFQAVHVELPVNIKILFEAMEECGSLGLEGLVTSEKDSFFKDVDYICICDGSWLGKDTPCIVYGLRGCCFFRLTVECASQDLHSGVHGGMVHEAMADLTYLLSSLTDKDGRLLITDIYNSVPPLHAGEQDIYTNIDFDTSVYGNDIGAVKLLRQDKADLLLNGWRYPSLSIHGIEGAHGEFGLKCVIPGKVTGKFSIRIVENQSPEEVKKLVTDYLTKKWQERGSATRIMVTMTASALPWHEDPHHPHYLATQKATKYIYKKDGDLIRAGGTMPIITTLKKITGKNIINVALSAGDDNIHAQNEKIDKNNYISGTKFMAAYLYEVSRIEK